VPKSRHTVSRAQPGMTTTATTAALMIMSAANSTLIASLWRGRLTKGHTRPASFRSNLALSALLSATVSSVAYWLFVGLWFFSRHTFNGRQSMGHQTIVAGLATAAMAFVGGLFGRSMEKWGIMFSALVSLLLWSSAAVASLVV
jgi:hypothetical protein